MTTIDACALDAALRCGNLAVGAWAPAPHAAHARAWATSVLNGLVAQGLPLYVLGHRPGAAARLPSDAVPEDLRALLASLATEPGAGPLHRVAVTAGHGLPPPMRAGDLLVRRRRVDDVTGGERIESTHLGRPLFLARAAGVLQAIRSVPAAPPLKLHLSCFANPWAGLRQPEARWLRDAKTWPDDRMAVAWRANTLCLLAGPGQVAALHGELTAHCLAP